MMARESKTCDRESKTIEICENIGSRKLAYMVNFSRESYVAHGESVAKALS